jgi:nickel transport system ATP-binding protein
MLRLKGIRKRYTQARDVLKAVDLHLKAKSALALVGASGSGKSTLAKLILGLEKPCGGEMWMDDEPLEAWRRAHQGAISVVFQDYRSSINPRFSVEAALQEPFWNTKMRLKAHELQTLLEQVELSPSLLKRYAHELSGGQLQRVCIARALARNPRLIVLDEALSALDVFTQAQILSLLQRLQEQRDVSYLLIAHDLEAASALCDEIAVLYEGRIVETLETKRLSNADHPYTKALLKAAMPLRFGGNTQCYK